MVGIPRQKLSAAPLEMRSVRLCVWDHRSFSAGGRI